MRLPRSSSIPFSIHPLFIALFIALALMLPANAGAATLQLVCSPANLRFGTVTVSQSETQLVVLTNTGLTSTNVTGISVSDSAFSVAGLSLPLTLAAGQSTTLTVTFSPTATGWTGGNINFQSAGSSPTLNLAIRGVGVGSLPLTASPASISFGQVAVGYTAAISVVLTNPHTWNETLSGLQTAGTGFSVTGPAFPVTLSTGQSIKLNVTFAPQAAGQVGGRVFVTGPALNIPLTGSGTTTGTPGTLAISPANLNFGKVMIGETGTQTAILSATGGSVTISSAASSNSQFALPGATFPVTIGTGQSLQLNVAFTPQSAGTAAGQLTLSSNASDSKASEAVAGTGTAPQVSLAWSSSTSQVEGYNVYRGTQAGSYSRINGALDPNTSYTDTTVASGTTYYYAATAVNSSGQESTYSAPVEVAVP